MHKLTKYDIRPTYYIHSTLTQYIIMLYTVPDFPLGTIGTEPMTYEEKLSYNGNFSLQLTGRIILE